MGDLEAAAAHLRALPTSNGKVGVIGYCSGGRQAYLAACIVDIDAAVDCYGGRVVPGRRGWTPSTSPRRCGRPCSACSAKTTATRTRPTWPAWRRSSTKHGKTFELQSYEGAGHAFFSVDRPSYRVEAAKDGWKRIWAFFGEHLGTAAS